MIKVNLLQRMSSQNVKAASAESFFSQATAEQSTLSGTIRNQFLARVLVLLIGPVSLYLYEMNNIGQLQAQEDQLRPQLDELQAYNLKAANSKAEVDKFKQDEARIQARIMALNKISLERLNEIKILDFLQQIIPEKVWLSTVDFKNGQISLSGFAGSNDDISRFQEVLTKSAFLRNVTLSSSRETTLDNIPLKQFEISSMMERTR